MLRASFSKVLAYAIAARSDFLESLFENSHEVCQIADALDWHGVIHVNSNAWVGVVSLKVYYASRSGTGNEFFFRLYITSVNSEDGVSLTAEGFVNPFWTIKSVWVIDEIPKHLASLLCQQLVVVQATHLVHIRYIESSYIHRPHGWSVVVCVWRVLELKPVSKYRCVLSSVSKEVFSDHNNSATSNAQVLLSTKVGHSNLVPRHIACTDVWA